MAFVDFVAAVLVRYARLFPFRLVDRLVDVFGRFVGRRRQVDLAVEPGGHVLRDFVLILVEDVRDARRRGQGRGVVGHDQAVRWHELGRDASQLRVHVNLLEGGPVEGEAEQQLVVLLERLRHLDGVLVIQVLTDAIGALHDLLGRVAERTRLGRSFGGPCLCDRPRLKLRSRLDDKGVDHARSAFEGSFRIIVHDAKQADPPRQAPVPVPPALLVLLDGLDQIRPERHEFGVIHLQRQVPAERLFLFVVSGAVHAVSVGDALGRLKIDDDIAVVVLLDDHAVVIGLGGQPGILVLG